MKKQNGFTLVELLAVIAILGIILTISVVSVNGVMKNSKKKSYDIIIDQVYEAYLKCRAERVDKCVNPKKKDIILAKELLVNNNYLTTIKSPNTGEDISELTVLYFDAHSLWIEIYPDEKTRDEDDEDYAIAYKKYSIK